MVSDFRYQDVIIGKPKELHWVRETIIKTSQMPEKYIENETFHSHLSYPRIHFYKHGYFVTVIVTVTVIGTLAIEFILKPQYFNT